jgi:hypothetical protein
MYIFIIIKKKHIFYYIIGVFLNKCKITYFRNKGDIEFGRTMQIIRGTIIN